MFDTFGDIVFKTLLVLGIGLALIIRLGMKHPNASGGIARGLFDVFFRK